MASALTRNRPELSVLRGKRDEAALRLWTSFFAAGDQAKSAAYLQALEVFLGKPSGDGRDSAAWQSYVGGLSPNTRRAYAFALNEFFEFVAATHKKVIPPHEIMQSDAEAYAQWLMNRPFTLVEEKLHDGEFPERLELFRIVSKIGTATFKDVRAALPLSLREGYSGDDDKLHRDLGRMVLHDLLVRRPTMAQLRSENPSIGIDQFAVDGVPLRELFSYSVPAGRGVKRRTVLSRFSALTAFWKVMLNVMDGSGKQPLVRADIWYLPTKRLSGGISQEIKQAAVLQRIKPELVVRLLHIADRARGVMELRDKAIVYLLAFSGMRVSELIQLRRGTPDSGDAHKWPGWFEQGEPPVLVITRKGGKKVRLPYPPVALKALYEFQSELERIAAPPGAQSTDRGAANYVNPGSMRWRYRELSVMPDAPLLPALKMWGANSAGHYESYKPNSARAYNRGLTRHSIGAILHRIAGRAYEHQGWSPEEIRQLHPHALRHFAATAMIRQGKPIREVQAILGHESMQTTEGYLDEEQGMVALSGQTEILQYLSGFEQPEPGGAPAPKPTTKRKVVETTGIAQAERPVTPGPDLGVPTPKEPEPEAPAVAVQALAGAAFPANDVPVAPSTGELEARAVATGAGQAVEVGDTVVAVADAEPGPDQQTPVQVQMIDGKSAGSPDDTYVALEQAQPILDALWSVLADPDREKKSKDAAKRRTQQQLAEADLEPVVFTRVEIRSTGSDTKAATVLAEVDLESGQRTEKVQKTQWLKDHYDPWPKGYGIGIESLLPWFTRGSPTNHGYVVVNGRPMAPLPVLSPSQVQPETKGGAKMLESVERIYDLWLNGNAENNVAPSPTRAHGLLKWYGFFAYSTGFLQRFLDAARSEVKWQPYNSVCLLGKHVRAHKDEWVESWLRTNAHTYQTALTHFKQITKVEENLPGGSEFRRFFELSTYRGISEWAAIPAWFADIDPIKALEPVEYDRFAKWISNVTGQRLTRERKVERTEQQQAAQTELEEKRRELQGLLEIYLSTVSEVAELRKQRGNEDIKFLMENQRYIEERFRTLGLADPMDPKFKSIHSHEERIEALIKDWSARHDVDAESAEPNVIGDSDLFDAEYFQLDRMHHTIGHTDRFKAAFLAQYGQDSELVMRRAARAMWEYAKETKLTEGKKATSSDYNYLYAIMLTYLSWVVPAPEEMEARIDAAGGKGSARDQRLKWIADQVTAVRDLIYRAPDDSEEELAATDEARARQFVEERGMDEKSAMEAAIQARILEHHLAEEMSPAGVELEFGGVEELLGGGSLTIKAPKAGAEEREAFAKKRKEFTPNSRERVIVRRKMRSNGTASIVGLHGEQATRLYALPHGMRANSGSEHRVYLTPEAWLDSGRYTANARQAMPSPFAMLRAMHTE
jgi:integrase